MNCCARASAPIPTPAASTAPASTSVFTLSNIAAISPCAAPPFPGGVPFAKPMRASLPARPASRKSRRSDSVANPGIRRPPKAAESGRRRQPQTAKHPRRSGRDAAPPTKRR